MGILLLLNGCSARTGGINWRLIGWIAGIVLLGILMLVLIPTIRGWQKRQVQMRYRLELHNEGNVRSRYALEANVPPQTLDFDFTLNGVPLHGGQASSSPYPDTAPAGGGGQPAASKGSGVRQAKKMGKLAQGFAGTISSILLTIGNLLPYSTGIHLIRIGSKMRQGQGGVERMGRMGEGIQRQKKRAQRTMTAQPPPPPGGTTTAGGAPNALFAPAWVETPYVEPGDILILDLQVSPENPYKAQRVPLTLRSRSLEIDGVPAETTETVVQITGLTPFQKYGPFLLLTAGVIGGVILLSLLMGGWS